METMYIFVLDIFVIILGILATKISMAGFAGFLITIGVFWDMMINNSLGDVALTSLTAIAMVISLMGAIMGWRSD